MKFTVSWLKDFLDTDASAEEIADKLTMIGLELESLSNPAEALSPFVIAKVLEARQHPNADRLRVCMVDPGTGETVQVVCGAPNARTGMIGVFAPVGSFVPGTGIELKAGNLRGEASNGMLVSERELLLSDDHEGIIDLPADAPVGTSYAAWAGLDDPVIDVAVTPNRPDALGVYGVARDLAAAGLGTLKPLADAPVEGTFKSPIGVSLAFDGDDSPCPLFVGRYIRGVTNGPSPAWMQKRLRAIGLRPISALVDVTNYMTHAYGRPLHVFDAAKVKGNISARLARPGETIEALDGRTYTLDETMTVIADEAAPEAIAGVMGGEASGVTAETTEVFLESAWFDPVRTAATGRKLNLNSDARYRFERGVDPAFAEPGAEIATRIILDMCGGEASEILLAGKPPIREKTIGLRLSRVESLAGVRIDPQRQVDILEALGFAVAGAGDDVVVSVPSWRPDVSGEADLVEEIVRIHGLEKIEHVILPRLEAVTTPKLSVRQRRRFRAARALASRGFNEAVTWSFLPSDQAALFGGGETRLKLDNPISTELSDMRPSLLAGLVAAAGRNADRGAESQAISEVGQVYLGDGPEEERLHASGIRQGMTGSRSSLAAPRAVDVFDAKADALAVLEALGAPVDKVQVMADGPSWYHPGRVGTIGLGPKNRLATFGEVHPRVLEALDVAGPLVAFEIDIDAIPVPKAQRAARGALNTSDYQPVRRDFAFVVEEDVAAEKIVRAARGAEKNLISQIGVFDVFRGASIGEGRKSIAIEVTMTPDDRTLTEAEIEAVSSRIVAAVEKATGGSLRR
ncbi:phenylalanine--tRNA ligase subunit beta [Afifella sp. IM 167]|uniref:phenylalanine--tRNA ligase subunit beta n=1 Tax=Afifella sp. IM 167 TaxID=2033586 RepID=UPI001CCD30FF|nr:phenylalanine--tRNA ligase subunit beta [Afifella sp. IM 167]MBZ8133594.1 phenylalanine--tRNA ligase subunit beta [Afifella sp. IM 167]